MSPLDLVCVCETTFGTKNHLLCRSEAEKAKKEASKQLRRAAGAAQAQFKNSRSDALSALRVNALHAYEAAGRSDFFARQAQVLIDSPNFCP